MRVLVHLHTILQKETPEGTKRFLEVIMPPGSTLADLLKHLEIDLDPEAMLLVINGRTAELDRRLQDGDEVNLMPAISGGGHSDRSIASPA